MAVLPFAAGAAPAARHALPAGDWLAFGRTADNNRHSPLTRDHARQRRPARPRLHRRLPEARPGRAPRPAVVPARDRRHALRHDERRQRLRARRRHRQGHLALQAAEQRALQELRDRREPRPRLLRRHALPDAARHAARRARPEATARCSGRVAIGQAVPGASSNYGYSETSAPICANHRVIVGAAGSEYGIRGFVMAYTTDLTPGVAEPVLDDPAGAAVAGGAPRASSAAAPSGRRSPSTPRRTPSTSAPARRRRSTSRRCARAPNPRTDSLIAVDLAPGS